jgi:hypothetical protein
MEQIQLNQYINREINKKVLENAKELEKVAAEKEKYLEELNNQTWQRIETLLHVAMRENRISPERINKIDARVLELSNENGGERLLLGEERKSDYKILESRDFAKMIEALLEGNCKNCHSRHNKCEVYGLLKKYNIPHEGKGKCKYSYLKIGKKAV